MEVQITQTGVTVVQQYMVTSYKNVELMEVPARPGPNDISGRTLYTLISAGSETNGPYLNTQGWDYPIGCGYSAIFEVEYVGENVRGFRKGDLAFCCGPHADTQICRDAEAIRLPAGMEPEKALFGRMTAISMASLSRVRAHAGDSVVVVGLGAVGMLAMQALMDAGYRDRPLKLVLIGDEELSEGLSGEPYPDRKAGGVPGVYTVEGLPVTPYMVPQECGMHMDTKWVEVTRDTVLDNTVKGRHASSLRIENSGEPFAFSCLPYTCEELENATHHEELPPARRTVLCVYGAVRGVGGIDSWGSDVEEAYHLSAEKDYEVSFNIAL